MATKQNKTTLVILRDDSLSLRYSSSKNMSFMQTYITVTVIALAWIPWVPWNPWILKAWFRNPWILRVGFTKYEGYLGFT